MAFTFGGTSGNNTSVKTAAAPATSAFSFGSSTAAAPSNTFSFGAAPAPAPATGTAASGAPASSFSFGAAPTPATAGTAASSAPASAFSFGAAPAPASAFSFGAAAPAPASTSSSLFGASTSTPAAAPSTFSFGGSTTPASAPAFGTSNSSSTFSFASTTNTTQQQSQPQSVSVHTLYKDLPENYRRVIDTLHENIMKHRRTMQNVGSMAPALLSSSSQAISNILVSDKSTTSLTLGTQYPSSPADAAAGPSSSNLALISNTTSSAAIANNGDTDTNSEINIDPHSTALPIQIKSLQSQLQILSCKIEESILMTQNLENIAQRATGNTIMHAQWPLEQLAMRMNVATKFRSPYSNDNAITNNALYNNDTVNSNQIPSNTLSNIHTNTNSTKTNTVNQSGDNDLVQKVAKMVDMQAAQVDRIEKIPSPFIWEQLHNLKQRLSQIQTDVLTLKQQLDLSKSKNLNPPSAGVNPMLSSIQEIAHIVRTQNDAFMRIAGAFATIHDQLEVTKNKFLHVHQTLMMSSYNARGDVYCDPFTAADIKEIEAERTMKQKIEAKVASVAASNAPNSQSAIAAPASATGGIFGVAAPAPATGGLFGSAPAPATSNLFGAAPSPAAGGLFGAAPAPASGGLFGSTPAPATGGLFGSTPAPAPATGGLFGSTPAPATSGLFGSTPAPAPATGGLFGSATAPAPASTTSLFGAPAPAPAGLAGAPAANLFGAPSTSSKSKSKSRSGRSRR